MDPEKTLEGEPRLPEYLKPFFWDVAFEEVSVSRSAHFVTSRLMEHGDEEACRFLMRAFSRDELRATVLTSCYLSRRSRKFWAILLDVEVESCTARQYPTPYGPCSWD